jgi:hypothetical protein
MKDYFHAKTGASVYFQRPNISGYWVVKLCAPSGDTIDRIRCDDYRAALDYRRAFINQAKNWG